MSSLLQCKALFGVVCGAALVGVAACGTTYALEPTAANALPDAGATDSQPTSDAQTPAASCVDVNLLTDPYNCGTCGTKCGKPPNAEGVVCANGGCLPACSPGFHLSGKLCEANAECAGKDTNNDPLNCGACGVSCSVPSNASGVSCSEGACVPSCDVGYKRSGTVCVCSDTESDKRNCGSCGYVCPILANANDASCQSGSCVPTCNAGYYFDGTRCAVSTGPCSGIDLQTNVDNCGTCGRTCYDAQHPRSNPDPANNGGSVTCEYGQCKMLCPTGYSSYKFRFGCDEEPS